MVGLEIPTFWRHTLGRRRGAYSPYQQKTSGICEIDRADKEIFAGEGGNLPPLPLVSCNVDSSGGLAKTRLDRTIVLPW